GAGYCRALNRSSPFLTATVVSPSPSNAVPSRHEASSPVTSRTGQPQVPQSAALMPVSPTSTPLKRSRHHDEPLTVCASTPSRVPATACIPTKSAASIPDSRNSVYSVHSFCTTYSHSGSSSSRMRELNVPPSPPPG